MGQRLVYKLIRYRNGVLRISRCRY